jgi:outer membrane receptor for ferrienterochelin and colicins
VKNDFGLMKLFHLIILLLISTNLLSQKSIEGVVKSEGNPVSFAKVVLYPVEKGTITDEEGRFSFENIQEGNFELRVTSVGYAEYNMALKVREDYKSIQIELEDRLELNEVVVTGTMRETSVAKSPVKIQVLTQKFFRSSPVNSVIDALETVNGVQEQVNCGVCGTNDIHINGMEGPYTLVLIDGMPIVSGLSSTYGFNGIPTSIIDRVEIVKGPSSTLYGTEAVGGVVNIITRSPEKSPLVDVETNFNTHQELKTNFAITPRIGKRVFTTISGDYYFNDLKIDNNKDGFTDIPLNNRISLFNKWQINDKKDQQLLTVAARYYNEDRFGGVLNWDKTHRGSDSIYGENIKTERYEVIGSFILPTKGRDFKLDFSANSHHQNSWYGDVSYRARQQVFFSNFTWSKKLGKKHFFLAGLANRYNIYEDNTPSYTNENDYVPGVFVQDEVDVTNELKILGGLRVDYHSKHGLIFSPRVSLKKQFGSFTALRFNYGTGFRQVHLFTEDHAFVSGSRDVMIIGELRPEQSHNSTFNFNHTYTVLGYGNLDVDVFYTYFQNKIIPDYEQDPNLIVYENLDGYGTTRGVSLSINHSFKFPVRLRLGTTFMDVFEMTTNDQGELVKEEQLFAPKFSGTFGLNYDWKKAGLSLNWIGKVIGVQKLPTFAPAYNKSDKSPWYTVQHLQITKTIKKINLEVYGGMKNIFNYTQESPLIAAEDPYSDAFDTSYAYGPLQGRRFFVGLRWKLNRKNAK